MKEPPKKKASPIAVFLLVLFLLAPPLGFLVLVGAVIYNQIKKNAGKTEEKQTAEPQKVPQRVRQPEAGRPNPTHVHTPKAYSYDSCAVEKRLEQLETLKKAGLMEKEEYDRRRQAILNGHT